MSDAPVEKTRVITSSDGESDANLRKNALWRGRLGDDGPVEVSDYLAVTDELTSGPYK